MTAEHSLTIPGRYDAVRTLCQFIANGAKEAGLDEDTIYHLELCCDEASTNIIEHAYGGESIGDIVGTYAYSGDAFTITLRDTGSPFEPEEVTPPTLPDTANNLSGDDLNEQLKIGGLGLHFIRQLMDSVTFYFDRNAGNTLVMVKQISPGEDA